MRIAFIRSVDLNQARPFLGRIKNYIEQAGIDTKLFYTDGDCNQDLFPGEAEKIPTDISCNDLVEKIVDWKADTAISISLPDDNSLRDACVGEILNEKHNIPMIMHPVESTVKMCSKWDTNNYLRNLGYPVPEAFLINGDLLNTRGIKYYAYLDCVLNQVKRIGFPVIIKPLWDSMSCGIIIIDDLGQFIDWLKTSPPNYDVSVEQFIEGELFGIEVLGHRGMYRCQPLVRKCTGMGHNLFPFDHLRFAPFINQTYNIGQLERMLLDVADKLKICGSIDVELIYKNGTFHIIEINPRVSGMTNLSSAVSGFNAYQCLIEMATGLWKETYKLPQNKSFAAEFPLEQATPFVIEQIRQRNDVIHINRNDYHDGRTQFKMILRAADVNECYGTLTELKEKYKIIPDHIIAELQGYISIDNEYSRIRQI